MCSAREPAEGGQGDWIVCKSVWAPDSFDRVLWTCGMVNRSGRRRGGDMVDVSFYVVAGGGLLGGCGPRSVSSLGFVVD